MFSARRGRITRHERYTIFALEIAFCRQMVPPRKEFRSKFEYQWMENEPCSNPQSIWSTGRRVVLLNVRWTVDLLFLALFNMFSAKTQDANRCFSASSVAQIAFHRKLRSWSTELSESHSSSLLSGRDQMRLVSHTRDPFFAWNRRTEEFHQQSIQSTSSIIAWNLPSCKWKTVAIFLKANEQKLEISVRAIEQFSN